MEQYKDAYEVLKNIDRENQMGSIYFDDLIKEFIGSYLKSKDFPERIEWHREPNAFIYEILNELYSYILKIQARDEMRDIEGNALGYVPTKVVDEWKNDRRLRSLYNSTYCYCKRRSKDFNTIAVHIAEYRAMNKLIGLLRRKINQKPVGQKTDKSKEAKIAKKVRPKIPKENKVRAELQKEVRSVCPFCDSTDVGHFHIHHIDEEPANNSTTNLLLVCPTCHSKITKGDIVIAEVVKRKEALMAGKQEIRSAKVVNFNAKVVNAVVGDNNTVTIKNVKPSKQKYPPGCIGYESIKANYVGHLIGRYNEYKEYEVGKGKVNYAFFSSHLKKRYKIGPTRTINNLPAEKFEELVEYIQSRIDGTMLAKTKGRNYKNYSSFEEYKNSQLATI